MRLLTRGAPCQGQEKIQLTFPSNIPSVVSPTNPPSAHPRGHLRLQLLCKLLPSCPMGRCLSTPKCHTDLGSMLSPLEGQVKGARELTPPGAVLSQ